MNIRHLEIFIEVVKCKSFSQAAEHLYISQPSVSHAITALENDVGAQLIFRSTKAIHLTTTGELFYTRARSIIELCQHAKKEVATLTNPSSLYDVKGIIKIAASSLPAEHILPKAMATFRKNYPNTTFDVIQSDSADVIKAIENHQVDIGLMGYREKNVKLNYHCICKDKLILVANKKVKSVNLGSYLKQQHFISRERGSGTRTVYEKFLEAQQIALDTLNICATFNTAHSVLQAVSEGVGVAIVSKLAADFYLKHNLLYQVFSDVVLPERSIYAVTKKGLQLSAAPSLFVDMLKDK